jgi:hypothetical protein
MRASTPGKGELAVHSFINKVYFWISPRSSIDVGTEWAQHEVVFTVPAPGTPGWHEQMALFFPRLGWKSDSGTLEVADLHLHRVTPQSEMEGLRAQGADLHSIVSDPLWADRKTFELAAESPAWKLGFQRIPFEQIGPQPEAGTLRKND